MHYRPLNSEIDIRATLPTIHVPTLILHRSGDRLINVGNSRYMAQRIPDAKYVELDGDDHLPWFGDANAPLAEIQEFLTGVRPTEDGDENLPVQSGSPSIVAVPRAKPANDGPVTVS